MSFLLLALFSAATFAVTPVPGKTLTCSVTESLGSSFVDGKYGQQNKTAFTFDLEVSGSAEEFKTTLIADLSVSLTVSRGSIGSQGARGIYLSTLDGVTGVETTDLIMAQNQPDRSASTTSWMRFYTRPNKDSLTLMCDTDF